jgi:CRISPR-associated protein Csd2
VQLTFARSVDPIVSLEHSITVCAARTEERPIEEQIGIQGRKHTVSYSLYRCHGFISAPLAEQTGFSEEDLKLFWEALLNMFEHDRSAARGEMNTRKLVVFEHDSKLGNFPAHKLFERVKVSRANDPAKPSRSFEDYVVTIDKNPINGVRVDEKL